MDPFFSDVGEASCRGSMLPRCYAIPTGAVGLPTVEVIPAIDLSGGRVVRLLQGDFDAVTTFPDDPLELAARFAAAGARWLHVIDLDAARTGERDPDTAALLGQLAARKHGRLQVGGGFRRPEQVEEALAAGLDRVLVGTLALRDPRAFGELVERHGERICLTADTLAGSTRIAGWLEDSGEPTVELVRRMDAEGVRSFLVTAIDRDGTGEGPDLELLADVRAATSGTLIASGGVGSAEHVRGAAGVGCDAIVIGKALLSGALSVEDALAAASG
jgi:phosphoribosylformimino-5-aminoimidazole carboxamide ribotide isomerase